MHHMEELWTRVTGHVQFQSSSHWNNDSMTMVDRPRGEEEEGVGSGE